MANWCDNRLKIKGHKNDIEEFLRTFWDERSQRFLMRNIEDKKSNWGISQEIQCYDSLDLKLHELNTFNLDEIVLEYETAFNPNNMFALASSYKFDKLIFTLDHYEPGAGYIGTMTAKKGCVLNIKQFIRAKDKSNEIEYYDLVFNLGFDDMNYILNENDLNKETIVYLKNKYLSNNIIIDITDKIKNASLIPEIQ